MFCQIACDVYILQWLIFVIQCGIHPPFTLDIVIVIILLLSIRPLHGFAILNNYVNRLPVNGSIISFQNQWPCKWCMRCITYLAASSRLFLMKTKFPPRKGRTVRWENYAIYSMYVSMCVSPYIVQGLEANVQWIIEWIRAHSKERIVKSALQRVNSKECIPKSVIKKSA